MPFLRAALGLLVAFALTSSAGAVEMTWAFAVQVTAAVSADPARVELRWTTDPFPVRHHTVTRKLPGERAWGAAVTLGPDATSFTDADVALGRIYEYQVIRHAVAYTAYGYIAVGINAPLIESRGRAVLVVDRSIAPPLEADLRHFEADLAGDGWTVVRLDIARDAPPPAIKAAIRAAWEADRAGTRAVILFGHVPVVRSGNLNVDGHGARPMPADAFYADLDGEWTDANGDGIYDQSTLPSDVDVMLGRIDFADLPGRFSPVANPSEVELLRRYLAKNHAYRHANLRPAARALVGNAIGDANGQAYAASAYRSYAPLVGPENVVTVGSALGLPAEQAWISRLAAHDYLFVFGAGGGSDFTIGGLGGHGQYADLWASDFLERKARGTFYTLFGSWFSEWDKPDNVMRTALAAPDHGLTAAWSGRPHLFLHEMSVGEPIGHAMRTSQNNGGLYQNEVQRQLRGVHIALLGDPTLRLPPLAPPVGVTAGVDGDAVVVSWKSSRDEVLGYHVYRGTSEHGPFTRVNSALLPADATRWDEPRRDAGPAIYQVRAVALAVGPSGSVYHASQGIAASVGTAPGSAPVVPTQIDWDAVSARRPSDVIWFDDALPEGAVAYASENDRWTWVTSAPTPFTGERAHQSENVAGLHHHFFAFAAAPLQVNTGDTLFAYVYLDPARPPRQVMLTWFTGDWEHRASWGEDLIEEGIAHTGSRRLMGPLPPSARWIRLEVPASAVDLEGLSASGMGFTLFDGRATWDTAGKSLP